MRNDTIRALEDFGIKTLGNQKSIESAEALLHADERVLFVTPTNIVVTTTNTRKKDRLPGVVFLTDKRLVFQFKALASFSSEVVPLEEIRSLNCNGNGLTGGHVEIHTMTKSFDILVSYKKDAIQNIQRVFENARNAVPAPSGAPAVSEADELAKFKKLLDDGVITAAEFEAKKKQILGI